MSLCQSLIGLVMLTLLVPSLSISGKGPFASKGLKGLKGLKDLKVLSQGLAKAGASGGASATGVTATAPKKPRKALPKLDLTSQSSQWQLQLNLKSLKMDNLLSECPCLNWAQVYERNMVTCGAAFEVPAEAMNADENECTSVFEKLDDTVCVNAQKAKDMGQWCYVSTTCMYPSANESAGTTQVNSEISWKGCNPDPNVKPFGDMLLKDKTMDELVEVHEKQKIPLGSLVQWSYPGWMDKWESIKTYFVEDGNGGRRTSLSYKQRNLLDMAVGTKAHFVFTSLNGKPPFAAIADNKLWIIEPGRDNDEHARVQRENLDGTEESVEDISIFTPFSDK